MTRRDSQIRRARHRAIIRRFKAQQAFQQRRLADAGRARERDEPVASGSGGLEPGELGIALLRRPGSDDAELKPLWISVCHTVYTGSSHTLTMPGLGSVLSNGGQLMLVKHGVVGAVLTTDLIMPILTAGAGQFGYMTLLQGEGDTYWLCARYRQVAPMTSFAGTLPDPGTARGEFFLKVSIGIGPMAQRVIITTDGPTEDSYASTQCFGDGHGSCSQYSTRRGEVTSSSLRKISAGRVLTWSFWSTTGTGTTIAKFSGGPQSLLEKVGGGAFVSHV